MQYIGTYIKASRMIISWLINATLANGSSAMTAVCKLSQPSLHIPDMMHPSRASLLCAKYSIFCDVYWNAHLMNCLIHTVAMLVPPTTCRLHTSTVPTINKTITKHNINKHYKSNGLRCYHRPVLENRSVVLYTYVSMLNFTDTTINGFIKRSFGHLFLRLVVCNCLANVQLFSLLHTLSI